MPQYSPSSVHFHFSTILLLFLVLYLPLCHLGSGLSLHNIQSPHLLQWQSKSQVWVQLQEQEWCGSAVIPDVWDTKTSSISSWDSHCAVVSVTSSLELPVLCVLRPTLVLCCALHPPDPLPLLFPSFSCYVFVMICAANVGAEHWCGWEEGGKHQPLNWSGDAWFGNPADCILQAPRTSQPLQRSDLLEDGHGQGSETLTSFILPSALSVFCFCFRKE